MRQFFQKKWKQNTDSDRFLTLGVLLELRPPSNRTHDHSHPWICCCSCSERWKVVKVYEDKTCNTPKPKQVFDELEAFLYDVKNSCGTGTKHDWGGEIPWHEKFRGSFLLFNRIERAATALPHSSIVDRTTLISLASTCLCSSFSSWLNCVSVDENHCSIHCPFCSFRKSQQQHRQENRWQSYWCTCIWKPIFPFLPSKRICLSIEINGVKNANKIVVVRW